MMGKVESIPQTIMATIAVIALRHMEINVPAALARFQVRLAKTGTKIEPESRV